MCVCACERHEYKQKIKVKASGYQFSGKHAETKIEGKYKHNEGERIVNYTVAESRDVCMRDHMRVQDGPRMVVVRG